MIRRLWRRLRPPFSVDYCRVCDRRLRIGQAWEERIHFDLVAEISGMPGGTWAAISYCRRHRPRGAIKA